MKADEISNKYRDGKINIHACRSMLVDQCNIFESKCKELEKENTGLKKKLEIYESCIDKNYLTSKT